MITLSQSRVTPVSNTGLFPHLFFETSVDTLTLVLRKVPSAKAAIDIVGVIDDVFSEKIDFACDRPTFMMKQWTGCSRSSLRGVMVHWQAPNTEKQGTLRIHLPGKALAAASARELYDCVQVLWQLYGGECTRVDVAADDYAKVTNLDDIRAAQVNRNYTGVRSHRFAGSGSLTEEDGLTYYFGSKSSDSQLRIYDKSVESKGAFDCIRWELQLRRAKAQELCNIWLSGGAWEAEAMASTLSGAIAGAVDFIDRSKRQKDLTRCQRLPWWARVRSCLSKAFRVKAPKKTPLMKNKIGWVCHAVMPSLAAIKKYLGDVEFWQFLEDDCREKEQNLTTLNQAIVAQALADDKKNLPNSRLALAAREIFDYGKQGSLFGPI